MNEVLFFVVFISRFCIFCFFVVSFIINIFLCFVDFCCCCLSFFLVFTSFVNFFLIEIRNKFMLKIFIMLYLEGIIFFKIINNNLLIEVKIKKIIFVKEVWIFYFNYYRF